MDTPSRLQAGAPDAGRVGGCVGHAPLSALCRISLLRFDRVRG